MGWVRLNHAHAYVKKKEKTPYLFLPFLFSNAANSNTLDNITNIKKNAAWLRASWFHSNGCNFA